ncbi:response regulator [Paenibacillus koleovorans]|uniref:response regulator n=1 Tax=Paenibacillus koleovorans TaxID=121608 RepID=UPI000FD99FE7|nr:response regulator [Paenibacillus koleovorans]
MHKLLIVDDEPTVRMGLRTYFDWAAYGIEVCEEADDGDVALEAAEKIRPDIVLTDVRMPAMDGITLSKELRKRFPEIKIIFVSGHDDADYLKSAMKVSAIDYIFKPVNLQELRAVVERVVAVLDGERTQQRMMEDMSEKLKASMPLLREKFLMSLVSQGASRTERIPSRLEFLGLRLPERASYWVLVLSVDRLADWQESRSEQDWQLLTYAVQNVCQELIDQHLNGYAFELRSGEFVGILYEGEAEEAEERLFALASAMRDNLQKWLKMSVTIGMGERVATPEALTVSFQQAREAAERKWYMGQNQILTMDSLEPERDSLFRFDMAQSGKLVSSLNAADPEQVASELEELFEGLAHNRRDGFKYARNVCMQLVLLAGQLMLELNILSREMSEQETMLQEKLFRAETIADLKALVTAYLKLVCSSIQEKRCGKASNLVERVRAVIERRYADNTLTVAEIGKEVFLTDTYVSLLFKQETGRTVNEYLTHVRIEKAKELLRNPIHKFYDVCYAVGYADPSYFSKLFKKVTGSTPSAYRETLG